eukprot:406498-Prymnesium_polylepis.2
MLCTRRYTYCITENAVLVHLEACVYTIRVVSQESKYMKVFTQTVERVSCKEEWICAWSVTSTWSFLERSRACLRKRALVCIIVARV